MKVISLNLSTLASGKYAPTDKSNLANVRWSINWQEILGEYFNTNRPCRVKGKLISATSYLLNSTNNLGTVRMSFTSNYSNINNGLTVGIPIIRQNVISPSTISQFIGTIAATTLTVNPFGYGQMIDLIGGTSGASTTTLTVSSTSSAIPIGSVITGQGIVGYVTITAQTSATTYTMSSAQTILGTTTNLTAAIPNNICLPINSLITGYGVSTNTVITAQTGPYTYTLSKSHTIVNTPMISNPNTYYFDLDIQGSNGLTISTPMSNDFNIQFLRTDETTLMQNVPEYTVLLNFDFNDNPYDSD